MEIELQDLPAVDGEVPGRSTIVCLAGAGRSGTTWLQNMLGSHPEIVTPQETNLFNGYIRHLHNEWERQLPASESDWRDRRYQGISAILTKEEFDELVREVVDRVYGAVRELKPSASVVLDKVPGYAHYGPLIQEYLPGAPYLHLMRDGRDVAASVVRGSKSFGRLWWPGSIDRAAHAWATDVSAARGMAGADVYHEFRFEDLRGPEGAATLRRAFSCCGVEVDASECEEILDRFSLEQNRGRPPSSIVWGGEVRARLKDDPEEPAEFFGAGEVGSWRKSFGWYERWVFDRYAGGVLVDLGYERSPAWSAVGPLRRIYGQVRSSLARWSHLATILSGKIQRNLRK